MSTRMTKSAILALQLVTVLALLTATAFSQTADSASQKHSLHAGAWALQFSVGGNFTLNTFDGAAFSLTKHTSERGAWRLGVSVSADVVDNYHETSYIQTYDLHTDTSTNKSNAQSLSIGLTRIVFPRPPSVFNVFYGYGPRFSYGRSHTNGGAPNSNWNIGTAVNWSAGLGCLIGVEVFPYKSLGLSAEYGTSLNYQWARTKGKSGHGSGGAGITTFTTSKGLGISSGGVRMGLSLYW